MKVSIVYLGYFLGSGANSAPSRRVRDIARGLSSHGHEVSVLLPRRSVNEYNQILDGIHVQYLGKPNGGGIRRRISFWTDLVKTSITAKCDWVMFYVIRGNAVWAARALHKNGISVATIFSDKHSINYKWWQVHKWILWAEIKSGEILLPKVSDLNICISSLLLKDCKRYAPKRTGLILPVLVDHDQFQITTDAGKRADVRWNLPKGSILISYLGGLWKHHGVADLVQAFRRVVDQYPEAHLLIAGHYVKAPTHDNIEDIVNKLSLSNNTTLPGWINTEQVIEIYSRSDILVLPQHDTIGIRAGLPTKIAEYAQMGKAIVATRTGDIGTYFADRQNAKLVPPKDIDALVTALIDLISNPKLRSDLGNSARVLAKNKFDYRCATREVSDIMIDIREKPRS